VSKCIAISTWMPVVGEVPGLDREFGPEFKGACREAGLRIQPVSGYCVETTAHADKLLAGYGHLGVEEIVEGVRVLRGFFSG